MADQKCPKCRLLNPPEAMRCDCGYDFGSRTMESTYLTPEQQARERELAEASNPDIVEHKVLHSGIIGGSIAMLVAAGWFYVGWQGGKIYFYPPILFVIGLFAVIRGVTR